MFLIHPPPPPPVRISLQNLNTPFSIKVIQRNTMESPPLYTLAPPHVQNRQLAIPTRQLQYSQKKDKDKRKGNGHIQLQCGGQKCFNSLPRYSYCMYFAYRTILNNRMNSSFNFKSSWFNSYYAPQTEATTFAFSSVFILFLCNYCNIQLRKRSKTLLKCPCCYILYLDMLSKASICDIYQYIYIYIYIYILYIYGFTTVEFLICVSI